MRSRIDGPHGPIHIERERGGAFRRLAFGFNRWKQKPIRIDCPGGAILIERERNGTVAVSLVPGPTVRLVHEEEPHA